MFIKFFYLFFFIKNISCLAISKNNFNFLHSKWDGKKFDTLIFEGGGVRAVVYSGGIKKLEDDNILNDISNIAGTSSGAQTAALLCVGYSSKELVCALKNAPWNKILNRNIFNIKYLYFLLTKFGLNNSKYLEIYLDDLIYKKTGIKKITFKDLYNKTNIHLKVGVCSLTNQEFKYIDHNSYPDMPVSTGLVASSSIPFIFTATKWRNELFVDGGLVGNLPVTAFPNSNCLAFTLLSDNEFCSKGNPKNIFGFVKTVLNILFRNLQSFYSSKNDCIKNVDYIQINTDEIGVLDVDLNNETIEKLIDHGYKAVEHFLDSK